MNLLTLLSKQRRTSVVKQQVMQGERVAGGVDLHKAVPTKPAQQILGIQLIKATCGLPQQDRHRHRHRPAALEDHQLPEPVRVRLAERRDRGLQRGEQTLGIVGEPAHEPGKISTAEPCRDHGPPPALSNHASHHGEGQHQTAAPADDLVGLLGQAGNLAPGVAGQHPARHLVVDLFEPIVLVVGEQDLPVTGGYQQTASRRHRQPRQHLTIPDVVRHDQAHCPRQHLP